ncbi:MAG: carbon-nitrogen hydrolase family protein [Salaquimonas sp.]
MGVLRVACLQMRSGTNIADNIEQLTYLARQAAEQGAVYLQSPEMSGLLQKNPKLLLETIQTQQKDPVFAACSNLAANLGIWFHLGSTPVKTASSENTKKAANRGALFSPAGKLIVIYDKIHMFDVDVDAQNQWKESNRFEAGNAAFVVEMDGVKLGLSICYDIRFAELYHQQAKLGAKILTCPSSFTRPTGQAHWEVLLKARAIENGAFMIAAAQGGKHEDGRETHGHSMIINPWGDIIAELDGDEPGVLVADIDLGEVNVARKRIPNLANERKFSISER